MSELLELAEDFDAWRAAYDDLTFDDQKLIYDRIRELHPNQRSASLKRAYPFFDRYQPQSVMELGGWDGFLAACVLGQHPEIRSWVNYDLTPVLQSCVDMRYAMIVLKRPWWTKKRTADAFVATHTIEHIRANELGKVIDKLNVSFCLIEAPLEEEPKSWYGYAGTHILEVGWNGVDEMFSVAGFGRREVEPRAVLRPMSTKQYPKLRGELSPSRCRKERSASSQPNSPATRCSRCT